MADNNTNDTNPSDVADLSKKLENVAIASPQTESSTAIAPANADPNAKATELGKDSANTATDTSKPPQNEETKIEETSPVDVNSTQNVDANTTEPNTDTGNTQQATATPQQPVVTPQQPDNKETEEAEDKTNLIINYLPPTMSEGTLATLFSPYGLLERCKIVVDLQTLRSRGYGFVKYDNAVSAERALTALNGYELNGKKLKVAYARPQCKAITNANLYITNVPPHFTDANLRKLFHGYGRIVECRVLKDQNGHSRGVGFVRMDTHHNAIEALQAMDSYVIDDKHPPLLVKLAQRRVPRRYWNAQNRNQNQNQGNRQRHQGQQGMGGPRDKKKGRNSPNRKYYPKGGYRHGAGGDIGGAMGMGGGIPSGQHHNRGSPSKQRGYYRPRQPYKQNNAQKSGTYNNGGGGGAKGGGGGNRMGGGGGGGGQGPPYFPAPMQQQYQEPYGMQQYPQPAQYAANLHMTAAAMNNAPNPSNVGPSSPTLYNVLVFNLPKHFNVDHIINMYAKFGPVQSVNIRDEVSSFPNKGPVGIISYFYFDDAQRAQNETNNLEIGNDGDTTRLETIFQPPVK
eukprot:237465_1